MWRRASSPDAWRRSGRLGLLARRHASLFWAQKLGRQAMQVSYDFVRGKMGQVMTMRANTCQPTNATGRPFSETLLRVGFMLLWDRKTQCAKVGFRPCF